MEKMMDMKMSKSEAKKMNGPTVSPGGNEYPWGLTLRLDDAALTKLGMKDMPEVGAECMIHAVGKVTRVSESASDKNESRDVEIQITKMSVMHDDEEMAEKALAAGYKKGSRRAY